MLIRTAEGLHATGALCRHMWWPLAYGGKVKDGCALSITPIDLSP